MRRAPLALLLLLGAAAAAQDSRAPGVDDRLAEASRQAEQAEERARSLAAEAEKAGSDAERLAARRAALAEQIAADEARITEASLKLAAIRREIAAREERIRAEKAPLSGLLAGLVIAGRQPPLLALVDSQSVDELVRVQALVESSLAALEKRARAIRADAARQRSMAEAARRELADLERRIAVRDARRARFAEEEAAALAAAQALTDAAFRADSQRIAVAENLADLGDSAARRRESRAQARALAQYDPAPPRPSQIAARPLRIEGPQGYRLPVAAPVRRGLGSLSEGGIRSRGLLLDTPRGARLIAPADGRIAYAGAFRSFDGVVIIDHGDGWASLLTGVATTLEEGEQVRAGASLGRAQGPVGVELWHRGAPRSPALIAGSSKIMSNGARTG
ncbi:murein hydrolase activator EnvC family protein [Sphingomicrobium lutaoense]|uniref:Septal ring factor EnvC (AmiA/AmiB activator) n=1 Tax=Sphingomicrobium lutaoense TaxID=515949 RepID=A0A839Z3S3_9SPHN|nr:peptidoglycan DD-metalloendopeptidase family protein [Sphingomicrobium lutaoense]MBB3764463.1 septal ring factor EnvC (AmiA/AmiB activator) [Sphingomicrobium lutaoense]